MTRQAWISIFIITALLVIVLVSAGCGAKAEAVAPPAPGTTSSAAIDKKTNSGELKSTTPSPAKPSTTPKSGTTSGKAKAALNKASFNLALQPSQDYIEYTLPVYLLAKETLHLNWVIMNGSDHIAISMTTPGGETLGVKGNGTFIEVPGLICEKLYRTGNIILNPGAQNWSDGYYIFHPHLRKGDAAVTVQVLYWIE